jgi:hypothetical protein
MIEWRRQGEARIQKRLQRARREGDLAKDVDPGDLARYISTVLTGWLFKQRLDLPERR